jgi:hypothetical protein
MSDLGAIANLSLNGPLALPGASKIAVTVINSHCDEAMQAFEMGAF